jgi:hypothetical protein
MYQTVGIAKLSDNQLSRLRNGHPVRIKLGNSHKIALNIQQLKKLHSASKKGSALTVSFDPYQKQAHGSGLLGDIAKKAKAFIQKHKLQDMVNPIISGAKKRAHAGVNYLSNRAKSKIDEIQEIEGEGIIGDIFSTIGNIANSAGAGIAYKKNAPSAVSRKRKVHKKKGKGIFGDIAKNVAKTVATKGIEIGSNYLKDKVQGMGIKGRIVGRRPITKATNKKKTSGGSGGALYPGGYSQGSALYPA